MRKNPTIPEAVFWKDILPKSQRGQFRWNRQKPFLQYIVDFYCAELKLIIEIDGEIHQSQKDYDLSRDEVLKSHNLKTVRFTNCDVLNNPTHCIAALNDFLL